MKACNREYEMKNKNTLDRNVKNMDSIRGIFHLCAERDTGNQGKSRYK